MTDALPNPWPALSREIGDLDNAYDVVVIGSGYGGGVAASRMARTGKRVAVLERGREFLPGDFPRDMAGGVSEFQFTLSRTGRKIGNVDGLYDLRINDDVNVFVGCGLGGTSLINANVAIPPDPRVFKDWPKPYRDDPTLLDPYVEKARTMLGSTPYPANRTAPKLTALEKVAKGLDRPIKRPDINVTFADGPNAANTWQAACNDCGDCVSGCNYGAKNTVAMNYLRDAAAFGAEIFTRTEVRRIERDGDQWVVRWSTPDRLADSEVRAEVVILAAGTLGTAEILMRSRSDDLTFSERLGQGFSGNGDVYAFGYNANMSDGKGKPRPPVHGVGAGIHHPDDAKDRRFSPGPCIVGMVDMRSDDQPLEAGVIIEEGAMPGVLAPGYAAAFPALDALMGDVFRFGDLQLRLEDMRDLAKEIEDDPGAFPETPYTGPVSRLMPFLVMSHDAGDGEIEFKNDRATVIWPGGGLDPAIVEDANIIRQASDTIKAEYFPMPFWQDAFGNRLVTVHPIGGCALGDDAETGVIDQKCRVFDGKGKVHPGLYVCDGAAIPGSLGVNPHLTITAVAERAMVCLAEDRGWIISDADTPEPVGAAPPAAVEAYDLDRLLNDAVRTFRQLEKDARNPVRFCGWYHLRAAWRSVVERYERELPGWQEAFPLPSPEDVAGALGTHEALRNVVGPLAKQALAVLEPIKAARDAGDNGTIPGLLEEHMGDFSPPVWFPELMRGHLSRVGLDDNPPPSDPYEVAGKGSADTVLVADIHGTTIRQATDPKTGEAEIRSGTLECPALGGKFSVTGTFRYLVPAPDEVEGWRMIYSGELVPDGHDGKRLTFNGRKTIRQREGSHWWRDLTVLDMDVCDEGTPVARGQLVVELEDLVVQARDLTIAYAEGDFERARQSVFDRVREVVGKDITGLPDLFGREDFRVDLVKTAVLAAGDVRPAAKPQEMLATAYKAKVFGRMGEVVMRSYGGIFSYMMPPHDDVLAPLPPAKGLEDFEIFDVPVEGGGGGTIRLTRYRGDGRKGPVMMASGFGVRASSFATPTVDTNLVQMLKADGWDVWLFDYRGCPDASRGDYTLDDVAEFDWPAAITKVLAETGAEDVSVVVHCVGSMSLFMAVLRGEARVRRIIASQLGAHAITNWFNYAKGDARIATYVSEGLPKSLHGLVEALELGPDATDLLLHGTDIIDPRSPGEMGQNIDQAFDVLAWKVPRFAPTPCKSPTCHRITAIFGPSYNHDRLNEKTHNAIRHFFGPVSTRAFRHVAQIYRRGHVISHDGSFNYMENVGRLKMPVHFIAGGRNQEMLPEASLRSLDWLRRHNLAKPGHYTRRVYREFGHMDCFIGKDAGVIFKDILEWLNED